MRDIINTSLLVFCFFTQKLHRIVMTNILLTNSEGPSRSDDSQLFLLLLLWSGGYHGMEFPRLFCTAWGLWGLGSLHTGLQSQLLTALGEWRPLTARLNVEHQSWEMISVSELGSDPHASQTNLEAELDFCFFPPLTWQSTSFDCHPVWTLKFFGNYGGL